MKRKAGWTCLVLLLAAVAYEFAPDGSSETGIPVGLSPPVREAIARLRSRRPSRRCNAAFELGRGGAGAAAPFLAPLLNDREESMGPVERIGQGLMMGAQSREVGTCAEFALSQLGAMATPVLIEAFRNQNALVRRRATRLLALSDDPPATQFLAAHLGDPVPYVRLEALAAVVQNRHPVRIEAIRRALRDADVEVRLAAVTHAGADRAAWAFDGLLLAANDADAGVRARAVDRLGIIGDRRAIDVLIDRLSDGEPGVRQMALSSLRMITKTDQGPEPAAWEAWRPNAK